MAANPSDARICRWLELDRDAPMALLERRRVIGSKVMVSHVRLQKGCFVATHKHENEQITCVLEGRLRFGLGDETSPDRRTAEASAGEVVFLPSGCPHSAEALEDTLVLDVFAPPSVTTGIDQRS